MATRRRHALASPPFSPLDDHSDEPTPKRYRTTHPAAQRVVRRRPTAAQDLRDALHRLQAAEEMKAKALQTIQKALPAVERMVQQSTHALATHADFCPSLWQSHDSDTPGQAVAQSNLENHSACQHAASSLRHALQNNAFSAAVSASATVARAGNELCYAASVVFHRREQLESTLSAHSSDHNARRSLCLRVLSIEYLRLNILGNLSLRKLWSLRRVCHEFQQWIGQECGKLQAVPFCNQSAYGGISMVNPGNLIVYKLGASPRKWLARCYQSCAVAEPSTFAAHLNVRLPLQNTGQR